MFTHLPSHWYCNSTLKAMSCFILIILVVSQLCSQKLVARALLLIARCNNPSYRGCSFDNMWFLVLLRYLDWWFVFTMKCTWKSSCPAPPLSTMCMHVKKSIQASNMPRMHSWQEFLLSGKLKTIFKTLDLPLYVNFKLQYTYVGAGFHTEGGGPGILPPQLDFPPPRLWNSVWCNHYNYVYNGYRTMNKQINSINGYSCVQAQVKMQLNFQNVINARVTCLRMHCIPPPPPTLKSCMKPCGVWKKEGGVEADNSTLRLLLLAGTNFSVLVVCYIWQVLILAFFND